MPRRHPLDEGAPHGMAEFLDTAGAPLAAQGGRVSRRHFLALGLGLGLTAGSRAEAEELRLAGTTYIDAGQALAPLGLKPGTVEAGKFLRLSGPPGTLRLEKNQRDFVWNQGVVWLGFPPALTGTSRFFVSRNDVDETVKPLLKPDTWKKSCPKLYRIVLDAGHGGKDPGARNSALKLEEKALTLQVARRLQPILGKSGYAVVLTREDDRFLELEQRTAVANRVKADLFVSLHFNAAGDARVEGYESFVFTPANQPSSNRAELSASDRKTHPANRQNVWNLQAGRALQEALRAGMPGTDRGLKRARFTVLRDLAMPGVLLELGFLSHGETARALQSPAHLDRLAKALGAGILQYQRVLDQVRGR